MKRTIPPNSFDFVFSDKVFCWKHQRQNGISILTQLSPSVRIAISSAVIKTIVEDLTCSTTWIISKLA